MKIKKYLLKYKKQFIDENKKEVKEFFKDNKKLLKEAIDLLDAEYLYIQCFCFWLEKEVSHKNKNTQ